MACCLGTHQLRCDRLTESVTTASALEDAICRRLVDETPGDADGNSGGDCGGDEEEEGEGDPVRIFASEDAHLLRCRPVFSCDDAGESSIVGIVENAPPVGGLPPDGSSTPVQLTLLEPRWDKDRQTEGCVCRHPRGDWTRRRTGCDATKYRASNGDAPRPVPYRANVTIVDLTTIQELRRTIASHEHNERPSFDTPGKVFHLLRSVLDSAVAPGLHCASPWNEMYCNGDNIHNNNDHVDGDQVVALLVKDVDQVRDSKRSNRHDQYWDAMEQREADELLNFRTGDAAPSFFLHSASQLLWKSKVDLADDLKESVPSQREEKRDAGCLEAKNALLLVYRRLPPRDVLSSGHLSQDESDIGCLCETYLEKVDVEESDADLGSQIQTQPVVKHRMVSPPYLSHAHEYPGLLDPLLESLDAIREEAQRIPQWTAWPEQKHYAGNSWNVFPLCYTFPANDITRRQFIQKTCAFVPETTRLLRSLGPAVRTALFSRLDPRARLGAHTGWQDLANHVLRVHIPLVVPGGKGSAGGELASGRNESGLCGTWVDGCVETHDEGRIVCFDDSKVHRAFNYSDGERVVLIVDLLRPRGLPLGTATGGHSDELDAFIASIS